MCRRAHWACPRSSLQPTHTEGTFQVQRSAENYSGKEVVEVDGFPGQVPQDRVRRKVHTHVRQPSRRSEAATVDS